MEKFLELLRESVIIQGLVTLSLVLTVSYLYASGRPVPEDLRLFLGLVLGFYFGGKVQALIHKSKE